VDLQQKRAFYGLDYHLGIWSTRDWRQQRSLEIPCWGEYFAVSPDAHWAATLPYGGGIRLWSLIGTPQTNALASSGIINGVAFSSDGRLLAAAKEEGVVEVWELPSYRKVKYFRARSQTLRGLAFSPDGRRLATAGEGEAAIKLWDVSTGQELITLGGSGESLRELAFSDDDNQLIARNSQGDLLFWRVPSFEEIEANEKGQVNQ
jgi:WD40 repeat protein